MWSVPELNEEYLARMEDILETYEKPYDPKQPVICLDEKSVTLHADVRPPSPPVPGREAQQDSEYERRGTANVFCAVEPRAGSHFTFVTPDRSAAEFAPDIHRRKSLTDYYCETAGNRIWDRFTVHYAPTHGSWLNQAEIEVSLFARPCLGQRRIPDLKTLQGETRAWNRRVNRDKVRINWRFDRKTATPQVRLYEIPFQAVTELAAERSRRTILGF